MDSQPPAQENPSPTMGPQFEIGAYWHGKPAEQAFLDLLKWIVVSKGYRFSSPIMGVQAADGRLPFFGSLWDRREDITTEEREVDSLGELASMKDWFPACVRLHPRQKGVRMQLEYAIADPEAHQRGDSRVIAVAFNGTDSNLLENMGPRGTSGTTKQRAARTEKWISIYLRGLSADLRPDYASCRMESFLPQPTRLLTTDHYTEFVDFYLSDSIASHAQIIQALQVWPVGKAERFEHGSFVRHPRRRLEDDILADHWRIQVLTWIKEWLKLQRRSGLGR